MGILLCEHNFRDVWIRNKSVRAEIGHILRTHTHTHTHTAKLVVEISHKNMPNVVIAGYFNLPDIDWNSQQTTNTRTATKLLEIISEFGLQKGHSVSTQPMAPR